MLLLLVIYYLIVKSQSYNYCNSSVCNNNNNLISPCSDQSPDPARHCLNLEILIKSDKDRNAILDKINSRRNKVASGEIRSFPAAAYMMKLEWNKELEMAAQRWANQCVIGSMSDLKDSCRHIGNLSVGQNIATVYGDSPGLSPMALVDIWYMELLNVNTTILPHYHESVKVGYPHYDYFTQLVWSDTREVGCGSVKFKERLTDEADHNRTVYRLVCNFAPGGNVVDQYVYNYGSPCSQCPAGKTCDPLYKALCGNIALNNTQEMVQNKTEEVTQIPANKISDVSEEPTKETELTKDAVTTEEETYAPFDYFSHFHDFTRQTITLTTTKPQCNDLLPMDEFIDLLKKKLSSDSTFKELLFATKSPNNFNFTENTISDPYVASFVNRIYSKKEPTTTTKTTEDELLNSTLLVDLVEAVIFRSGDRISATEDSEQSTQSMSNISPVKIQAELAQTQLNNDFSGHYFFPEDEGDMTSETAEAYYDSPIPPISDVFMEIEDIKKSTTVSDFLDEILDFESSTESTVTLNTMSPDAMSAYHGRNVMNKFLEDIKNKTT